MSHERTGDRTGESGGLPDTLTERIGLINRREAEARILAPVIDALGREFGREKVIAVVSEAIRNEAREQGRRLAAERGDDLAAFASILDIWSAGGGIEYEMIEATAERLAFNVTRCRYAELYRALGLGELGAVFSCNRDGALIEGFNPAIRFERAQTLMEGAPFCTFRYALERAPAEKENEGAAPVDRDGPTG